MRQEREILGITRKTTSGVWSFQSLLKKLTPFMQRMATPTGMLPW